MKHTPRDRDDLPLFTVRVDGRVYHFLRAVDFLDAFRELSYEAEADKDEPTHRAAKGAVDLARYGSPLAVSANAIKMWAHQRSARYPEAL